MYRAQVLYSFSVVDLYHHLNSILDHVTRTVMRRDGGKSHPRNAIVARQLHQVCHGPCADMGFV